MSDPADLWRQHLDAVGGFSAPAGRMPPSMTGNAGAALGMRWPTRDDMANGLAETIGAPVDGMSWILRRAGLPASSDPAYGPEGVRRMIDTMQGVSLEDVLAAMSRYRGLF